MSRRFSRQQAPAVHEHAQVWRSRLVTLAEALDKPVGDAGLGPAAAALLDLSSTNGVWVGLYALTGQVPEDVVVVEVARRCGFEGPQPFVDAVAEGTTFFSANRDVEVLRGATLVDVGMTAAVSFRTGIQRVSLETAVRWKRDRDVVLVGWTRKLDALRLLEDDEVANLFDAESPLDRKALRRPRVVVPLGGRYLTPELNLERDAVVKMASLGRHGGLHTGVVGFDCVPLTSSETSSPGVPAVFANHLAALKFFDRVAAISEAAHAEYAGWARMLGATGLPGPRVSTVALASEMTSGTDQARADTLFRVGSDPVVLVVGSHEPRKNHLAVLAAAERLWLEGLRFSLTFVGGGSWQGAEFAATLAGLQARGLPVAGMSGVSDPVLAGGYRLARFTVFPSLNEGFGLPIVESLAAGTPVITSNYGSMKEIADGGGGALLVDPRDDDDITDAMRRLLTDDVLLQRLRDEAAARTPRTWDQYADELWQALVD